MKPTTAPSQISAVFRACRMAFLNLGLFSCVLNILMLTGPLFMLQIYDRVLASKSIPTLVALAILAGTLFIFFGLFELIRSRILSRIACRIDEQVHAPLFAVAIEHSLRRNSSAGGQPFRDLDTIRQFLSGPALGTLFDLPWSPIYLGVIFLMHPYLGYFSVFGIGLLIIVGLLNDRLSRGLFQQSVESSIAAHRVAEECRRNATAIRAMGMLPEMRKRWQTTHSEALHTHVMASDRNGTFFAIARMTRLSLQSAILALGAYLVIGQEMTAGSMIAASIILTRAAAPIEQGIAQWRGFIQFRAARQRLERLYADLGRQPVKMQLPPARGNLQIDGLTIGVPSERKPILRNVHFRLSKGQALGVIGPAGAGKSTLARALVNVWQPMSGTVSMDGAPYDQWDTEALGRAIGYLPQEVELFDGSFDENIARFNIEAPTETVIQAARLAAVHDLILSFPDGYKTQIGEGGARLSAGQRQRIGLARALYGNPVLVVMDEPNANLDAVGEMALSRVIRLLKKRGTTVVVIAHRPNAIASVDLLLCLKDGGQFAFGSREEVLGKVAEIGPARREARNRQSA